MRAKYTNMCSCGYAYCMRRHRAYVYCDPQTNKYEQVQLSVKGKCSYSHLVLGRAKKDRRTKDKGISPIVKPIISRMIKENIDLTPKACHLMLINGGEVKNEHMPYLHQVICVLDNISSS